MVVGEACVSAMRQKDSRALCGAQHSASALAKLESKAYKQGTQHKSQAIATVSVSLTQDFFPL